MKILKIIFLVLFISLNCQAEDNIKDAPAVIKENFSNYNLIGFYDLKVMGFNIYRIKLWSEKNYFSYQDKFAIDIEYKRNFNKDKLTESSINEIKRINNISDEELLLNYQNQLLKLFSDVKKGDRKIAIYSPNSNLKLYHNSILNGEIKDQKFARYFIDIWLSDKSKYPKMTKAIINKNK